MTVERNFKRFLEHSKKLQVVVTLYGEEDAILPALEQYKSAIHALQAFSPPVEMASHTQQVNRDIKLLLHDLSLSCLSRGNPGFIDVHNRLYQLVSQLYECLTHNMAVIEDRAAVRDHIRGQRVPKVVEMTTPPKKELPQEPQAPRSMSLQYDSLFDMAMLSVDDDGANSRSWPRKKVSPYNAIKSQQPAVSTIPEDEGLNGGVALKELAESLNKSAEVAGTAHEEAVMLKSRKLQSVVDQLRFLSEVCLYDKQVAMEVGDEFAQLVRENQELRLHIQSQEFKYQDMQAQYKQVERNFQFAQQSLDALIQENAQLKLNSGRSKSFVQATLPISSKTAVTVPSSTDSDNIFKRSKSLPGSPNYFEEEQEPVVQIEADVDYAMSTEKQRQLTPTQDPDITKAERAISQIERFVDSDETIIETLNPVVIPPTSFKRPPLVVIKDEAQKQRMAAVIIQKQYRGYMQRRRYRKIIVRQMIAKEILETEVNYVRGLVTVLKHYVTPLQYRASSSNVVIPHDKLNVLFFHVREILSCNTNLLLKLGKRVLKWNDSRKVGDVFKEFSKQFSGYSLFVSNYNHAMEVYRQFAKTVPFAQFVTDMKSEKRSLSLPDLLITPIQRIPRYVLLLKELQKNTHQQHPDFQQLEEAIVLLQQMATFINERKRDSERLGEVEKIQAKILKLPFLLASPNRLLVLQGDIGEINEAGKLKNRYVVLFNDIVICTQPQKLRFRSADRTTYEYKWSAPIHNLQCGPIERVHERRYSDRESNQSLRLAIGLIGDERKILIASSSEDMEKWLQAFADAKFQSEQMATQDVVQMRKVEVPQVELQEFVTWSTASRFVRNQVEELQTQLDAEMSVLQGLKRLDKFDTAQLRPGSSASLKTKSRHSIQKQQSVSIVSQLQQQLNRYLEVQQQLQSKKNIQVHQQDLKAKYVIRYTSQS